VTKPKTTLEQWRILQAVVDYGGYVQAAEKLHRSHSSLNHAVNKLQQQLGVELLEVKGRKAVLTSAGQVLLRRSRQLTQDIFALEALADSLNLGWEPEILLSVESIYPKHYLLPALQTFYLKSRGCRLKIVENVITGSDEAITQHKADIVICSLVPTGYMGEPLSNVIHFYPVAHPQHRLFQLPQPITEQELKRELQIVIADTATQLQKKTIGWLEAEQRWTVDNFVTAIDILKAGLGFCWVPEHFIQTALTQGDLKRLQIRDCSYSQVNFSLVLPQPEKIGPATRILAQLLIQHGRSEST